MRCFCCAVPHGACVPCVGAPWLQLSLMGFEGVKGCTFQSWSLDMLHAPQVTGNLRHMCARMCIGTEGCPVLQGRIRLGQVKRIRVCSIDAIATSVSLQIMYNPSPALRAFGCPKLVQQYGAVPECTPPA